MVLNIIFVAVGAAILLTLALAPEETTPFLPHDSDHQKFFGISSKKQAEKFCVTCHDSGKVSPLPESHPPKFRCLFCHKRKD